MVKIIPELSPLTEVNRSSISVKRKEFFTGDNQVEKKTNAVGAAVRSERRPKKPPRINALGAFSKVS